MPVSYTHLDVYKRQIKAYENQEIDFAVVPVENSIEGSVHETIDYLDVYKRQGHAWGSR